MAEIQHLLSPPILEALIDFRFNVPEGVGFAQLNEIGSEFANSYPLREEQHQIEFSLLPEAKASGQARPKDIVVGYVLRNEDKTKAIVLRRNGCSASHVRRYSSWEDLELDAKSLFEQFVRLTKAEAVTRVAARFINRIDLPPGTVDLDDLLVHGPRVPNGVHDELFSYRSELGIGGSDSRLKAVVRQSLVQGSESVPAAIVIDSDVYREEMVNPVFDDVAETLVLIRDLKNRIFFGSLHDKAIEPFK